MHEPIEEIESQFSITKIYLDEDPDDPRNWDNLGRMICFHRRYRLGDKHDMDQRELVEVVKQKDVISLPLYLYDHSGISMSCSNSSYPYNDCWDAGMVGYIYVTHDDIKEEYSCRKITKMIRGRVIDQLKAEVETYNRHLTGDVYGYVVTDKLTGEDVDSCYGYFGYDYIMKEVNDMIANKTIK